MRNYWFLTVLYFACIVYSCNPSKRLGHRSNEILTSAQLQPFGRFFNDNARGLELISSASNFAFEFNGDYFTLNASAAATGVHNYLQYTLDGNYVSRLKVINDTLNHIVVNVPAGHHRVEIFKATEATTGPLFIKEIMAPGIRSVSPDYSKPLIEFVGNSITCGAASDTSEYKCSEGEYHDHHNAYEAYGPRVARALDVNYLMSCVSGIGIYRTWNKDHPSMPLVYENERFNEQDTMKWNFKKYTPDIVSIALGTNDLSNGDGVNARKPFDSSTFTNDYIKFVKLVKSKYPKAIIALLTSPMVDGAKSELLKQCLYQVKQQVDTNYPAAHPVEIFEFLPMKPGGCGFHPSVEDHAVLAKELEPFFRRLLKDEN